MRVSVLASGSSGNCVYVAGAGARGGVLVDAGLSPREVLRRLDRLGVRTTIARIDGVLVTHEHGDHGGHAAAFAKLGVPIYASAGTATALEVEARLVTAGIPFHVGDLRATPIEVPHDAAEPLAFRLDDGVQQVGVLLDCGWDDPAVARALAGVDLLVIEFNHDEMLLEAGPYPAGLKRRIAGRRGHLNNEQAASLLRQIGQLGEGRSPLQAVVLAHLSRTNNRPLAARAAATRALPRRTRVVLATQGRPTAWLGSTAPSQLAFGFELSTP